MDTDADLKRTKLDYNSLAYVFQLYGDSRQEHQVSAYIYTYARRMYSSVHLAENALWFSLQPVDGASQTSSKQLVYCGN